MPGDQQTCARPSRRARRGADLFRAGLFLFVGVSALAAAGCGSAPESGPQTAKPNPAEFQIHRAHMVFLQRPGRDENDRHLGFIEERVRVARGSDETETRIFMVLDKDYSRPIGFYLENGATFLFDAAGNQELIGNFDINPRLERLYHVKGTFRLTPVD